MKKYLSALFVAATMFAPLAASAASNVCLTRTLTRGSRGADVSSMQQYLVAQKLLAADGATGFFGAMTEAAVQKWQVAHGPVSSGSAASTGFGMVGAKTRALLCAASSVKGSAAATTATASSTPTTSTPASESVVSATPSLPVAVGTPPRIGSFIANPDWINAPGPSSVLGWTAFDAATCDVSSDSGAVLASAQNAIGALNVTPATTTTYTLTCKGMGDGSTSTPATKSATRTIVIAHLPPTCSVSLDKTSYTIGDTAYISWTSSDADNGSWLHDYYDIATMPYTVQPTGRSFLTLNLIGAQTLQLTVVGIGGSATCSARLNVVART